METHLQVKGKDTTYNWLIIKMNFILKQDDAAYLEAVQSESRPFENLEHQIQRDPEGKRQN